MSFGGYAAAVAAVLVDVWRTSYAVVIAVAVAADIVVVIIRLVLNCGLCLIEVFRLVL